MIYLSSDHGGFDLKEKIKNWLTDSGYDWEDLGNKVYDGEDDYPKYAFLVAQKVAQEEIKNPQLSWKDRSKGILCCRSSAGMVIAANKVKGARAVTAFNVKSAKHSREHNDANILALSGDWLAQDQVKKILEVWLTTEFDGQERHVRRLKQIKEFEKR